MVALAEAQTEGGLPGQQQPGRQTPHPETHLLVSVDTRIGVQQTSASWFTNCAGEDVPSWCCLPRLRPTQGSQGAGSHQEDCHNHCAEGSTPCLAHPFRR
jgi:hypothetical protein